MALDYNIFPAINASLNGASAILITSGRILIHQKKIRPHRACMIAAVVSSSLFLVSYVTYHLHVRSVHFPGQGWVRTLYFVILISHTFLAATVVPLVLTSLTLGLRERFDRHRRISRWTFPVWLYVSVTGVVVYVMLYKIYGAHV
jgi:putative membrane protein